MNDLMPAVRRDTSIPGSRRRNIRSAGAVCGYLAKCHIIRQLWWCGGFPSGAAHIMFIMLR
jgi:hypothetical protein